VTSPKTDDTLAKELAEKTFDILLRLIAAVALLLAVFFGYDLFAPLFHLPQASFLEVFGFILALVSLVGIVRLGI
jgi:hypothetical protein